MLDSKRSSKVQASKMELIFLILFAVVVGMLLPIQAASNAGTSNYLGDVAYTALLSFVVGTLLITAYILVLKPSLNSEISELRPPNYILLGGIISVIYTLAITFLSPRLGVGNTLFIIVVGQMVSALLVDHFGVFDSIQHQITLKRVIGVGLMLLGLYLAKK